MELTLESQRFGGHTHVGHLARELAEERKLVAHVRGDVAIDLRYIERHTKSRVGN